MTQTKALQLLAESFDVGGDQTYVRDLAVDYAVNVLTRLGGEYGVLTFKLGATFDVPYNEAMCSVCGEEPAYEDGRCRWESCEAR